MSFRDRTGTYCRVSAAPSTDGIACRDADGWALRRTRTATAPEAGDHRPAGSETPALMVEAQGMMAGEPLDAAAETAARDKGWR